MQQSSSEAIRTAVVGTVVGMGAALPVWAADPQLGTYGSALVKGIGSIVQTLTPIVFALILLAFFWGLATFVFREAKEGKESGKKLMIWSVIALFVAASIWGIVALLQTLFGVSSSSGIKVPSVTINSSNVYGLA